MSGGPGPDVDPHRRRSGSRRPGADRPHRVSDRPEEEPRWIPDHLSGSNRLKGGGQTRSGSPTRETSGFISFHFI